MNTYKVGVVDSFDAPIVDTIRKIGDLGFDFIEILMHEPKSRPTLAADAGAVRSQLDRAAIDCLVHLPFTDIEIGSPHEYVREGSIEELRACLRVAEQLGAKKATVHATSSIPSPELREGHFVDAVGTVNSLARTYGIELCVENLYGRYPTVHDLDVVLDRTAASVTLDTGHARIEGYTAAEMASLVAARPDRISHVHLNDTRGRKDEHLPFGAGTIDFERFFGTLGTTDWAGTLALEVNVEDFEYIEYSKRRLERLL